MISSITIEKVRKGYYPAGFTLVIDGIEFDRQSVHTLVGPNGSGKTSLLGLIALVDKPNHGKILFDEESISPNDKAATRLRRKIGFIMQNPYLFDMNVYENVALGLKIRRKRRGEIISRVEGILAALKIEHLARQRVKCLSRGEYQKVAIAQVLVMEPEVILMDEPLANIDTESALAIEDIVKNIRRKYSPIIITTAHSLSQAYRMRSNIILLKEGRRVHFASGRAHTNFEMKSQEVIND
ncbi:MAG: ATP-binding cassette domain-containing protein [Omnitrophica bacterium]|nr:ATP-binding cassette domain-containing protein [Candidatus Omnitrophota bacterium]